MTLCDVWKLFSYCITLKVEIQRIVVLKFERCEHRDDNSKVDEDQEGVKCQSCQSFFQQKRELTLQTYLIFIYNRSAIPMFTPFKPPDN